MADGRGRDAEMQQRHRDDEREGERPDDEANRGWDSIEETESEGYGSDEGEPLPEAGEEGFGCEARERGEEARHG
jgi:hypothetical protein